MSTLPGVRGFFALGKEMTRDAVSTGTLMESNGGYGVGRMWLGDLPAVREFGKCAVEHFFFVGGAETFEYEKVVPIAHVLVGEEQGLL